MASFAKPVGVTVAAVVAVAFAALLWQHYRGTDEAAERRSMRGAIYATVAFTALTVALGILGWA